MTYDDLERSDRAFWRHSPISATSSRPMTLADFRRVTDAIPAAPAVPILLTSTRMLEGAGRWIGWPYLEAHFEAIARGAAHTIFGNIALDVRAVVSARAAGIYALGGVWPFAVRPWSEPRQHWDD